jgi:hypothetical protein
VRFDEISERANTLDLGKLVFTAQVKERGDWKDQEE